MPENTINHYLEDLNKIFTDVLYLLSEKDYNVCEKKIIDVIKDIKTNLREKPWGKFNDYYNNILIFGILFKSILDLLEIINITSDSKWVEKNEKIEQVWLKMLDCKERVLYVKNYLAEFLGNEYSSIECLEKEYFDFVLPNIEKLEYVFEYNYGESLYMSVEFLYNPICNICFKDIRTCEHREKRIYNGDLCKIIRADLKIEMTNVVYKPHDYRCRIWRWNIDTKNNSSEMINTTFKAPLFTFFEIDDFLRENED